MLEADGSPETNPEHSLLNRSVNFILGERILMIHPKSKRSFLIIAIMWLLMSIVQDTLANGDWEQLREAVRQGDIKKINLLLGSGVDINHQDNAGWTVLHWWNFSYDFSDRRFLETLRVLIKRGVNVNTVDTRGRTALMLLLVPGDDQPETPQLKAIQILIDGGSDLHIKNEWGESASSLGLASKFKEVRALFMKLDKASSKQ